MTCGNLAKLGEAIRRQKEAELKKKLEKALSKPQWGHTKSLSQNEGATQNE